LKIINYRIHYGVAQSGPFRIFPGRLSVSRSFGDPEAKLHSLGGNPNVLISVPEIKSFKIKKDTDFILIGCDGIFDKLSNCDVVHSIWSLTSENHAGKDLNEHSGKISDMIIRNCLASNANDNLTCIFICFENFKNLLYENNGFKVDIDKLDKIIKNLVVINNDSFLEKENENLENDFNSQSSNTIQTNSNVLNTNNDIANRGMNPTSKSSRKSVSNTNKNENQNSEKSKDKKNLNINWKLNTPGALKVLSPINKSNINKHFSPTNSINNLNTNFIANNNFNQTTVSNEDGFINKKIFSNKNVNFSTKLDMISPKNSINPLNKKLNLKINNDDKLKSLPAINLNGLKKPNI